jgi:RNA ligase
MTLGYKFPFIYKFSQIAHIFAENENYIVAYKDGYTVINYVRAGKETHPIVETNDHAILREARGLIFDSVTGRVIARRFHKFFNLGEREDVMEIDLSKPHVIMDKLDGSMITPIPIQDGSIRWGTKMGITDVAMQAEVFVAKNRNYDDFAAKCIEREITPIFEWVSRQQRIVVDYGQDNLILLAVRDNYTGEYFSRKTLEGWSEAWDIPLVGVISCENMFIDQNKLIEFVRVMTGIEGFIIQFEDGHMVKLKTDEYVSLHRAKSLLDNERDVVGLILDEKMDDLLPLLPDNDKVQLEKFAEAVWHDIFECYMEVNRHLIMYQNVGMTRKDFALNEASKVDHIVRSLIFANFDKSATTNDVVQYVRKHLGSKSQFEKCDEIFVTAKWKAMNNE